MSDDEVLSDFIKKSTVGVWHASCTCRMGVKTDKMAVTDSRVSAWNRWFEGVLMHQFFL